MSMNNVKNISSHVLVNIYLSCCHLHLVQEEKLSVTYRNQTLTGKTITYM